MAEQVSKDKHKNESNGIMWGSFSCCKMEDSVILGTSDVKGATTDKRIRHH